MSYIYLAIAISQFLFFESSGWIVVYPIVGWAVGILAIPTILMASPIIYIIEKVTPYSFQSDNFSLPTAIVTIVICYFELRILEELYIYFRSKKKKTKKLAN
jgi:hypothetical protein